MVFPSKRVPQSVYNMRLVCIDWQLRLIKALDMNQSECNSLITSPPLSRYLTRNPKIRYRNNETTFSQLNLIHTITNYCHKLNLKPSFAQHIPSGISTEYSRKNSC
jgi:hypothetical protein